MNAKLQYRAADSGNNSGTIDEQTKPPQWRYILITLAAFTINFTACGLLFSFGVFQAHYETMALQQGTPFTGASSAEIDLIGTLSASLMTIMAPFVLAWAKYYKTQVVICVGGLLFGLANVLASYSKALWHFQLAQGLLLGVATGLAFTPSMTVTPTWFDKHRVLAMGIVSAGTGIGGLAFTPAVTACINSMGFRNTLRLTGCLATGLICAASTTFQSAAYYTPVFFTIAYAQALGFSAKDGANITAAGNACNAIGKIAVGFTADRVGRLNSFFLTTLVSAISCLGLWLSSTIIGTMNEPLARSLFLSFTVLYGLFASAFISLFPAALIELFGVQSLPQIAGVMYMLQGLSVLVGTPVAGVLTRGHGCTKSPDSYVEMAALVGTLMLATSVTVFWVRMEAALERRVRLQQWSWKL